MTIRAPKGTRGIPIQAISQFPEEAEVLLTRVVDPKSRENRIERLQARRDEIIREDGTDRWFLGAMADAQRDLAAARQRERAVWLH